MRTHNRLRTKKKERFAVYLFVWGSTKRRTSESIQENTKRNRVPCLSVTEKKQTNNHHSIFQDAWRIWFSPSCSDEFSVGLFKVNFSDAILRFQFCEWQYSAKSCMLNFKICDKSISQSHRAWRAWDYRFMQFFRRFNNIAALRSA